MYDKVRTLEAKLDLGPGQIPENERKYKIEPVGEPLSLENPPVEAPTGERALKGDPIRRADDSDCGFEILDDFQRFNHCNTIYSRATWDPRVRSEKATNWFKGQFAQDVAIRDVEGFRQKDIALRNAGWVGFHLGAQRSQHLDRHDGFLDDLMEFRPPASKKVPVDSTKDMAAEVKQAAKVFGADLVGICAYDERWTFTHKISPTTLRQRPIEIPKGLKHVVVMAFEMPQQLIRTVPSALSGTATGFGYSRDAMTLSTLAQFIRNLGYEAIASLNDTAGDVPYALQAGLGEYGRHGLLITKEFGPRVRIGKIFTDLPLAHDKPIKFGVKEFCDVCRRCSNACPPQAIPHGEPQSKIINQSNFVGIRKWTVDAEKCFKFWINQGTDCTICIRVCPYNKDFSRWYFRLGRWLAGGSLRRLILWLDSKLGFDKRKSPDWWWKRRPGW
jgi:reductive dehalogenase